MRLVEGVLEHVNGDALVKGGLQLGHLGPRSGNVEKVALVAGHHQQCCEAFQPRFGEPELLDKEISGSVRIGLPTGSRTNEDSGDEGLMVKFYIIIDIYLAPNRAQRAYNKHSKTTLLT